MVRVGVRPEKLRLLPAGEEVDRSLNVVRGTITLTTYLGASRRYQVARGPASP